jgi:ankyrin repeat protein
VKYRRALVSGDLTQVKKLLKGGASIKETGSYGSTAMMLAADGGTADLSGTTLNRLP